VAVSLHATPAEVDDCAQAHRGAEHRAGHHRREKAIGIDTPSARRTPTSSWRTRRARLAALDALERRKALVDELLALRAKLRDGAQAGRRHRQRAGARCADAPSRGRRGAEPLSDEERAALLATLKDVQARLTALQGETR
jgi:type VI secretion system protein VasG